ncbi:nematocyst expressed protein 4-like [Dryobates pubescens]|uniref:nematocyst expressed protein 4-like n=1 Tax=Dryobates pubescens TaxID=118200 RepID=UPI0023B8D2B6|nr:nematocyst expressed protein 4-like [Dryobates pubescens]
MQNNKDMSGGRPEPYLAVCPPAPPGYRGPSIPPDPHHNNPPGPCPPGQHPHGHPHQGQPGKHNCNQKHHKKHKKSDSKKHGDKHSSSSSSSSDSD